MQVLDVMIRNGRGLPPGEIAALTDLRPNQLHRYLVSFVRTGMLSHSPDTGLYDLGPKARVLGAAAFARFDPMGHANEAAQRLAAVTGHTVCLFGWTNIGPVMLGRHLGIHPMPVTLHVGSVLPLHGTVTGQVFVRLLPAVVTAALVAREVEQAEDDGHPVPPEAPLEEVVESSSGHTIFWSSAPILPGSMAAAAVRDGGGTMRCLIGVMVPRGRAGPDRPIVDAALGACARSLEEDQH